ncbi:hypothetical protein BH10PLA1_BH10PLA1_16050 [soil metagenome]
MNASSPIAVRPWLYSPGKLALASTVVGAAMWLTAFAFAALRNHDAGNSSLLWHVLVIMFAIAWAVGSIGFYVGRCSSRIGDGVFAVTMLFQGIFFIAAQLAGR